MSKGGEDGSYKWIMDNRSLIMGFYPYDLFSMIHDLFPYFLTQVNGFNLFPPTRTSK